MSGMSPEGEGALAGAGTGAVIGSVVPGIGTIIGGLIGAGIGAAGGFAVDKLGKGAPSPSLVAPSTPAASQPAASTTAIQSTLASEQNARSTGTLLTAPGGLTDEPTTTSSLLTGI